MSVEDGLKLVVSGGIVAPEDRRAAAAPGALPGPQGARDGIAPE
jgi:uncharacterized membrane protein